MRSSNGWTPASSLPQKLFATDIVSEESVSLNCIIAYKIAKRWALLRLFLASSLRARALIHRSFVDAIVKSGNTFQESKSNVRHKRQCSRYKIDTEKGPKLKILMWIKDCSMPRQTQCLNTGGCQGRWALFRTGLKLYSPSSASGAKSFRLSLSTFFNTIHASLLYST